MVAGNVKAAKIKMSVRPHEMRWQLVLCGHLTPGQPGIYAPSGRLFAEA